MRITFSSQVRDAYDGIQNAAERMLTYQQQVSTGMRVSRPSDDPAAAATAISEKGSIAAFEQYSAQSRLTVADTVLSDILDKITSARSVILSVQGSVADDAQRQTAAQELSSLRDAILADLNTTFRGTYMFGGAAGTVRPYTSVAGTVGAYAASTRTVSVDIDRGRSVTVGFDGSAIAQGADVDSVFSAMEAAMTAATARDSDALADASNALQRAFDRATQAQSGVGTNLRAIVDVSAQLAAASRASKGRVSTLEEANMAQAITNLSQAETAYQAALGAGTRAAKLSVFDYLD
jgi:flagellar hook-associated protein 3 FlgL